MGRIGRVKMSQWPLSVGRASDIPVAMIVSDYHVHTPLCNHATGSMEAAVRAAMDQGLSGVCFLEHLTLQDTHSQYAMAPAEVPLYFAAARRLADRYEDRIDVKVGLEVDFSPQHWDKAKRIADSHAFDVLGASVHYVAGLNMASRRERASMNRRPTPELESRYLDLVDAMVSDAFFDVVCHADLMKKFGDPADDTLLDRWRALAARMAEAGLVLEINTSGWRHPAGEAYPAPGLLQVFAGAGVDMVFGSDAHAPEDVGHAFDRALDLARATGCRHLAEFHRRTKRRIPIEATGPPARAVS